MSRLPENWHKNAKHVAVGNAKSGTGDEAAEGGYV
jgi:hypothetical protein